MASAQELFKEDSGVMPFVRFERRPIEDKAATLREGRYIAKDMDFALVTPPYSKDVMIHKVDTWFQNMETEARKGRVPEAWLHKMKDAYQYFLKGQEMPLDGTPIKGWGIISPAQQEMLIRMHVLTVEQLAAINDEGIRRVGMGGVDLKRKAEAWLKSMEKGGKAALAISALEKENDSLRSSVSVLAEKVEQLTRMLNTMEAPPIGHTVGISADDLLDVD